MLQKMGNNTSAKLTKPSVSLSKTEKKLIQSSWSSHVRKDEFIGAKVFDRSFTQPYINGFMKTEII